MLAMCAVELCRRIGISPSGFYYLQTMDAYRDYQKDFSKRVYSFGNYRDSGKSDQERRAEIAELLHANVEASKKKLESWKELLEKTNHNPKVAAATCRDVPNALICLDGARTLFDEEISRLFLSFRDVISKRFA